MMMQNSTATTTKKFKLTAADASQIEFAGAQKSWILPGGVRSAKTHAGASSADSPHKAEAEAELATALKREAAQDLFRKFALKLFGLKYERGNQREGVCAVTGQPVAADRGWLVQKNGQWVVYSRQGVAKLILENSEIEVKP